MTPAPDQTKDKNLGCIAAALIGLLVIFLAMYSGKDNSSSTLSSANDIEAMTNNEEAAPETMTPLPLDRSAVRRGAEQMNLVAGLKLSGGAKIFSQNCYEALAKPLDWHELDRCGGFDAVARRWAEESPAATPEELDWFQPEIAATRYLSSATSNGLPAGDADLRWAAIEAASRKLAGRRDRPPKPSKVIIDVPSSSENVDGDAPLPVNDVSMN